MSLSEPPGTPSGDDAVAATPLAVELAKALKVELRTIRPAAGSGPITELDVREAVRTIAEAARTPEPAETIVLAEQRGQPAGGTAPLLTVSATTPVGALAAAVEGDPTAELVDLVLYAVAATLGRHPELNAHLVDDEIRLFEEVNLGFSVVLDEGLVFPVLRGTGQASLAELVQERRRLAQGARSAELKPWELAGGTFTVCDLGPLGVVAFTPAPALPQVAALGVSRLEERPAVVDGALTARSELPLSLRFDSRGVDAAAAARFLHDLADLLDDAGRLGTGGEPA